MRTRRSAKVLGPLVVATAASAALLWTSFAPAAPVTVALCAKPGSVSLPDGVTVPTWGFVSSCGDAATVGGPVLEATIGDVVTIDLTSSLPAGHTASFELPGLPVKDLGGGQYEFTASRAGTFAYQSPGDAGRQEAMGLYGVLVVRPVGESAPRFASSRCSAAAGSAYGAAFDRECVLLLSALDPSFNADPDGFDLNDYLATYWLINGTAYDPSPSAVNEPIHGGAPGSQLLLRTVNAGFDNTSMSLVGLHEKVVARDAYGLANPVLAATETIAAGATEDAVLTMPPTAPPGPNGFPLFNRNLHVTNGTGATYASPGGMLTFVTP